MGALYKDGLWLLLGTGLLHARNPVLWEAIKFSIIYKFLLVSWLAMKI